jgi:uncharacterized protein YbjT (DUF2867 family)
MKVVIIGGSGLIGKKLSVFLRNLGQEVVSASPSSGVNSVTGEGVAEALAGAQVVVDVSNSPSFDEQAVLEFFEKSSRNLLSAAKSAGVQHYIALSVVGADRLPDSGYMRAKVAQEKLIAAAGVPYTILRATQFYEFVGGIAESGTVDGTVRLPPARMQPIAADDVAQGLADVVTQSPVNSIVELAGPELIPMDEFVRRYFSSKQDERKVVTDAAARYFGAAVNDQSLTPGSNPRLGAIRFEQWLGA